MEGNLYVTKEEVAALVKAKFAGKFPGHDITIDLCSYGNTRIEIKPSLPAAPALVPVSEMTLDYGLTPAEAQQHYVELNEEAARIALARCLRVIAAAVDHTDAYEPLTSLADDIEAQAERNIERAATDEAEHDYGMRTSARYRKAMIGEAA